ncbi:MAG: calcium-binding protein [Cyanobacteria bacterium J06649_11]
MKRELSTDAIREIIESEIEVDCYDDYEVNYGWFLFLSGRLEYPFTGKCSLSKIGVGTTDRVVKVIGSESKSDDFTINEFWVKIELDNHVVPMRLSALKEINASLETLEVIEIWHFRKDNC